VSRHSLRAAVSVAAAALVLVPAAARAQRTLFVGTGEPYARLTDAVHAARAGDRIVVRPGTYREPTIVVDRPVEIVGEGRPTLDGEHARQIMLVTADDVTVRGLRFAHVGVSYVQDNAAVRFERVRNCVVADNRLDDAFFGIYLANVTDCRIEGNIIAGLAREETSSGNGIHLWSSRRITITGNQVRGQRDGIYFEFVHESEVRGNLSEGNLRYGLHFMYSDDCRYLDNTFRANGAGVAVMYTKRVTMVGNRFERNWGAAAYGLLLKEIYDAHLERNVFRQNTTGLFADGANRLVAAHNDFIDNGWALKLDVNTIDGNVTANNFEGNTFDVVTNGRDLSTTFRGNYWDAYDGYDRNHDGVGDVPFRPVRLFSIVVERNVPALILLRSAFVRLIDATERVVPVLTPEALADSAPAMKRIP
jgi:nitrous oxidase accessory protein